jgi:Uma2 family endonuclease
LCQVVLILTLQGDAYQQQRFQGKDNIISPSFPAFELTVEQVLRAAI